MSQVTIEIDDLLVWTFLLLAIWAAGAFLIALNARAGLPSPNCYAIGVLPPA